MTDNQIKHMVERFLGWKLPENFNPDNGVTFEPRGNKGTQHEYDRNPQGTNLFDYTQAEAMVRHMVEGLPDRARLSAGVDLTDLEIIETCWLHGGGYVTPDNGYIFPSVDHMLFAARALIAEAVAAERHRLGLDTPLIDDWHEGVKREVAHQINRWGSDHDAGKKPEDWFWLLGYLGGKALHAVKSGDLDKAKHHIISTGAALFNWFRVLNGANDMRLGIMPPKETSDAHVS